MRMTSVVKVLGLVGWMLPLVGAGCMVRIGSCGGSHVSWGHSVSERDGRLTVDGVLLEHERWVEVALEAKGLEQFSCGTSSGPIELEGGEAERCALSVHVYSQLPEDGEVYLDSGKLSVRSQHGKIVYINGVRGRVPPEASLALDTGSGDVSVASAAKGRKLSVDTGSGDVTVTGSEPASIDVDTGSGDTRVSQSSGTSLFVDTGSGDVHVEGGKWGRIDVDGGSSDLTVEQCQTDDVSLESGSGDLVLSGGHCKRAQLETGSGDVTLRDGATVDSLNEG